MITLDNIGLWILLVVLGYFLASRSRIAKDQERFAVITLGKFTGLKGPGIVFKWSGKEAEWTRVSCGDRGEVISPGVIRVNAADVPCVGDSDVRPGTFVRVSGFDAAKVKVVTDGDQRRALVCERCGHENRIS